MNDLDREIRRLGGEIRSVEDMLVEAYGLTAVTPAVAAELGSTWARRLRALCQRASRPLDWAAELGEPLPVRAPQPD